MSFLKGRVAGFMPKDGSMDINTFPKDKFDGFPFTDSASSGVWGDDPRNQEFWKRAKTIANQNGTSPFQEYQRLSKGEESNPMEQEMVGHFFGEKRSYSNRGSGQGFAGVGDSFGKL